MKAQEVFLTERVSHVVRDRPGAGAGPGDAQRWAGARDGARGRADAMLQRVRDNTHHHIDSTSAASTNFIVITVQKAILILDKIYDTFFSASEKFRCVRFFQGHFIKIEFLDKLCRPVYKEFDVWPDISIEPDLPKEKKVPAEEPPDNDTITSSKMTRKNRPKIKEKEEKETKGGYCEMCNTDYVDAALHRRTPHHLAFVRDPTNFLALDSLIGAGADVATFLDKTAPLNGERRSLRIMCNGEPELPKPRRGRRSQSPTLERSGAHSPRRPNGGLEARVPRRGADGTVTDDRHYYKVVGVSTKLRSSGGFATRRRESPPPLCNGAEPLVVKFRRVRRSELSVLSDEAEQFMFPKRASSTSSSSSGDEEDNPAPRPILPQLQAPLALERRRLARPLALKEESSEEDSWPEDRRKRKRRGFGTARRGRPTTGRGGRSVRPPVSLHAAPVPLESLENNETIDPPPTTDTNTLIGEPAERCLKWENGKLNYTPAVEQLEFAFERVPCSEPWFETFKRQDEDKVMTRNVPQYFALYSKSPKLPYEIGQLPPLKPNCCPLSDLVKREERGNAFGAAGSSRGYGTRGFRRQRGRKRTVAALLAFDAHPRKSPREHASTLAILGSAGLLHRRRHADDTKSTASEDTLSETLSATKLEPVASETRQMSERLQQFFSEVFEDVAEYDLSDDTMEGETAIITSTNMPDVLNLVSESGSCETIRDEIKVAVPSRSIRKGYKFKKKNRTGWPNKKKLVKKEESILSGAAILTKADTVPENRSLVECLNPIDESTQEESTSETEEIALATYTTVANEQSGKAVQCTSTTAVRVITSENETSKLEEKSVDSADIPLAARLDSVKCNDKSDNSLRLDVKVLLRSEDKLKTEEITKAESGHEQKNRSQSSISEDWEREEPEKRRVSRGGRKRGATGVSGGVVCKLLQPVVRVARVDGGAVRTLRSAGRTRSRPHPHRLR
ncbi:Protein chiffon [Eumeta japonica]|uniref:Protein chiffon n=1 Tax=Eumeta variegata TaxID=151549 RepID=A0A4C1Z1L9_EUMVA|nr:Protein chiffon [Eumeta japonica]